MQTPYLDYYRKNAISPVKQDLSNLDLHLERRASLYRDLGILPPMVAGRSVIEFGPGSGHNAIYTSSLGPRRYVLVDGNPTGLAESQDTLRAYAPEPDACEFVYSLIDQYATDERFDLVLCEGTISDQIDTRSFARRVGSFTAVGGILVVTTMDAATALADFVRRLVAAHIVSRRKPAMEQLEVLRPLFADHLSTLDAVSRHVDDWILDSIPQPVFGDMFSVGDAIDALRGEGLEIYHASPRFDTVWRWYKRQVGEARDLGGLVTDAYLRNVINLMDYRTDGKASHDAQFGARVVAECDAFLHAQRVAENETENYAEACERLRGIAAMVRPVSPLTADSLDEALILCSAAGRGSSLPQTPAFRSFWGHGQQYLSFVRFPQK